MRVWPGLRLMGGRRKDTQGRLCGRGGSGAGWSETGQRHAAELLRATRPSHAVTRGSPSTTTSAWTWSPTTSRCATCTWALRAAGGLERAARRLQGLQHEVAHLEEHAPLPGHQPHVPGLHKRAAPAARELRVPAAPTLLAPSSWKLPGSHSTSSAP